jgi:hypothetical protein
MKRVRISILLLSVLVLGGLACPNWNRPKCPQPGAYDCFHNQPRYCGEAQEWTPVGDHPCRGRTPVCRIDPDGVGTCAATPAEVRAALTDGGVE